MIKILFDLLQFLYSALPLITCVTAFTLLSVLLSKSIKKYAIVYYIVLGLPFVMVAIPFIGRIFGVETFGFSRVPFLGGIIRDYIHAGTFGFPLLIIIMYMGALNPRISWVNKLMSIRKELSIISGFPIFTHSLIRVSNNFPKALKYFTHHDEYMETAKVVNETGAWISNFSFVLGIVLLIIFIPLWVTSFDSVRKRMGGVKWKKLQKWSYVLYALLFIHAVCIQVGGILNPRGGSGGGRAPVENIQNVRGQSAGTADYPSVKNKISANAEKNMRGQSAGAADYPSVKNKISANAEKNMRGQSAGTADYPSVKNKISANAEKDGRGQSAGAADIKINPRTKQYIHLISLVLIFGSYLYLRLRKRKKHQGQRI